MAEVSGARAVVVHGHARAFSVHGSGPALLLLHGIGGRRDTWDLVTPVLAQHFTVITPDLLGHGDSAKPRADYSLGGYANGMRDLLGLLEIDTVTVVGHSFGGGVAMQFVYQYPERTERLVLVASGGLGPEVSLLLRALTLPGTSAAIAASHLPPGRLARHGVRAAARLLSCLGGCRGVAPLAADIAEALTIHDGLRDPGARAAFIHLLRQVVDWRGQVVTMRDRAYLCSGMPTLVLWGEDDHVLPSRHARTSTQVMPGSRLVLLPRVGHFPHRENPEAFCRAVMDFVASTSPSTWDAQAWRQLLRTGPRCGDPALKPAWQAGPRTGMQLPPDASGAFG